MNDELTRGPKESHPNGAALAAQTEAQIIQAVRGIRFGSVEISIQDGKVVQIERKEKVRLTAR